jgi:hypothetical protein
VIERGANGLRRLGRLVQYIREATAEPGVGATGIIRDLLHLKLTRQVGVRTYFQYRLFDPSLSAGQKLEYLPNSNWATNRLWDLLNPVQYRSPFRNKLLFNRTFGQQGFPVARVRAVYDPDSGDSFD